MTHNFTWPTAINLVPEYSSFSSLIDDDAYNSYLEEVQQEIRSLALAFFSSLSDKLLEEKIALACTGSDGRFEKNDAQSPLEVLVITDSAPCESQTIETIRAICASHPLFAPVIEYKNITVKNSAILFEPYGTPLKSFVMPNRGLDACFLTGDPEIFHTYKLQFYESVRTTTPNELKEYIQSFVLRNLRQFKTGKGRFNKTEYFHHLQTSDKFVEIYYNGAGAKASKYTLLRAIQIAVSSVIFEAIRASSLCIKKSCLSESIANSSITIEPYEAKQNITEDIIDCNEIPLSTHDRLQWIFERGLIKIDAQLLQDIQDIYRNSLKIQHICQKLFSSLENQSFDQISLKLDADLWNTMLEKTFKFIKICEISI